MALPVMILNRAAPFLEPDGPIKALIIAIAIPLVHGLYGLWTDKKVNWISVLGVLNVALTGGFGLMKLAGLWFAVKEASVPALIGCFVFASSFRKRPLFSFFIEQPALFKVDLIQQKISERSENAKYKRLLKKCTLLFSGTFFISSLLNFILAIRIFTIIPTHLSEHEKGEILNQQIADMTLQGYIVIALPLMIITGSLFYYCLRRLSQMSDLTLDEMMIS